MSKTQNAVNSFLESLRKRENKVKAKVMDLTGEEKRVHDEIKMLTKKLVELDLNGDDNGQAEINKKLASLRTIQNELADKISAYNEITVDKGVYKDEISKILDIARKEQKDRFAAIEQKRTLKCKMDSDLELLTEQICSLDREISNLTVRTEASSLRPLLPYIEPRKVKFYSQESLLDAVLGGRTEGELYEQYIEEDEA